MERSSVARDIPSAAMLLPVDEAGRPVQPVKVEVACTKCGGAMAVRRGRRGSFLGCTNYPKCRGTAPIPDDLKDKLAEQAAAGEPRHRLEGDPHRGNMRPMRRSDARPSQPARLLPGLCPVSPVQGHKTARRGNARQDHRGDANVNRLPARRPRPTAASGHVCPGAVGEGDGRPTAMA